MRNFYLHVLLLRLINVHKIDGSRFIHVCPRQCQDLQQLANQSSVVMLSWSHADAYTCTDTASQQAPREKPIQTLNDSDFEVFCKAALPPHYPPDDVPTSSDQSAALVYGTFAASIGTLLLAAGGCYYKRRQIANSWFRLRHHTAKRINAVAAAAAAAAGHQFQYDAFISFNERDRQWVYTHLVPRLEAQPANSATGNRDEKLNQLDQFGDQGEYNIL